MSNMEHARRVAAAVETAMGILETSSDPNAEAVAAGIIAGALGGPQFAVACQQFISGALTVEEFADMVEAVRSGIH